MSFCSGTTTILRLRVAELHRPEIDVCLSCLSCMCLASPFLCQLKCTIEWTVAVVAHGLQTSDLKQLCKRNEFRSKPQKQMDLSNHLRDKITSDKLVWWRPALQLYYIVDEDDGARWPRWEGGGVCCCLQTGHRRQLRKINILLLFQTGAKVQEKMTLIMQLWPSGDNCLCWPLSQKNVDMI